MKRRSELIEEFLRNQELHREGDLLVGQYEYPDDSETDFEEQVLLSLPRESKEDISFWLARISVARSLFPGALESFDETNGTFRLVRFVPRGTHQPELSPGRQVPSFRGKAGK